MMPVGRNKVKPPEKPKLPRGRDVQYRSLEYWINTRPSLASAR